jgi:hypothetical protein
MFFLPRTVNTSFPVSIVQARNRATGAAMSLLNKDGTRNIPSGKPNGLTGRNNSFGIELDGPGTKRLTFAEDFMMEHSHSGRSITLTGIAVSYATTPKEPQSSDQSFGFPF